MGASVELRMRCDCDSQLAQCAVRGQAPLLRQARVPATTEAVSNDGDGDDHELTCGSTQGGGLWGAKHLAVEEDTGADALAEKEGTAQLRGLPQVCMRDYILPAASER